MNRFTAEQIAHACGGRIARGEGRRGACGICTDTRTMAEGEAFLALAGANHDGHDFVPQALEAGAPIVVVERFVGEWPLAETQSVVVVEDTTSALMRLASWHRGRLQGSVLAVTGSCGKSTVKEMTGAILKQHGSCTVARKSFNNHIGVPLTILSAREDDAYVVLELGASRPGEIEQLASCARPDLGLITCIGECHLEGFGSREGVREAKAELIPHLAPAGVLVLNADDPLCVSLASKFAGKVATFGFGSDAEIRPEGLRRVGNVWTFEAAGSSFRLPVPCRHNVLNAAAAVCLSLCAGATPEAAAQALSGFALPDLRFRTRDLAGVRFIEDCYNSNPTALRAAVDAFVEEQVRGRRVVVSGDMLELGEHGPELHRRLGRYMATQDIQMLVAVGRLGRHLLAGWNELAGASRHAMHFNRADEGWLALWGQLRPGDAVLVKGSRANELERITALIARHLSGAQREAAA